MPGYGPPIAQSINQRSFKYPVSPAHPQVGSIPSAKEVVEQIAGKKLAQRSLHFASKKGRRNGMNNKDIIRAWKDEQYRLSLSDAERARLPTNPAGIVELSDSELQSVAGGTDEMLAAERTASGWTLGCCTHVTNACGFSWYLGTYGCCPESYAWC
jgi:mersacidin/lichenicidin family type 2 lantibiotic